MYMLSNCGVVRPNRVQLPRLHGYTQVCRVILMSMAQGQAVEYSNRILSHSHLIIYTGESSFKPRKVAKALKLYNIVYRTGIQLHSIAIFSVFPFVLGEPLSLMLNPLAVIYLACYASHLDTIKWKNEPHFSSGCFFLQKPVQSRRVF